MRIVVSLFLLIASSSAFAPNPVLRRQSRTVAWSTASTELSEGLFKTVSTPGNGQTVQLGDIATVQYTCYLPDNEKALPFCKSPRQKVVVGDTSMIAGWDRALRSMQIGERSVVRITDPALAYGEDGVPPVVPPNAVVEVDMTVLDAQPAATNIDFDSLAVADSTPRTASDIAAAFEARQLQKSNEPELEGLDAWIAKAKKFYFYGLFEGETGERPPWFLRPSITFPIAFVIVGAAFYVSVISGAISERGAQVTDELDEIILSSNSILENPSAALATVLSLLPDSAVDLSVM